MWARRQLGVYLIAAVLLAAVLVGGCGGEGTCPTCFGGARGYVYQPLGGGTAIVSASATPPAGYEPVPAGTVCRLEGLPDLDTATDVDGRYYFTSCPPGTQVLIIEAPGGAVTLSIPIICGRVTDGGGHTEGGG